MNHLHDSIAPEPSKETNAVISPKADNLAKAFSRLGWLGFWIQVAVGAVPALLIVYVVVFAHNISSGGHPLIQYLTIANLLAVALTMLWSYRYTRLARQIADPQRRPSDLVLHRTTWAGVAICTLSIAISVLVTLVELAQLLFYFLKAPQAGVPVIQTTGGGPASWVSTIDIMSLTALLLALLAELVVLAFSQWLAFRTSRLSAAN
jgi:hypothetical protein